jgi:hypothetical protein
MGEIALDDLEDDSGPMLAAALDAWVQRIRHQYLDWQGSWWPAGSQIGQSSARKDAAHVDRRVQELAVLLRRASRWEQQRIASDATVDATLSKAIGSLQAEDWSNQETLLRLLKSALYTIHRAKGTPEAAIDVIGRQDTNSWLRVIDAALPVE